MNFEEPLQGKSTEEIFGGVHILQTVLDYFYESLAEDIKTQEEFNEFAEKYESIALMPEALELALDILRNELSSRT